MEVDSNIVDAIRKAMPAEADIDTVRGLGGFSVGIGWPLSDDPDRPNKMSRIISIVITDEAARDFTMAVQRDRADAFERVHRLLTRKLADFDPQHDVPRYGPPPVEQWTLSGEILPI